MNGLLLIDKPAGPTSHDLVARARRALGERRIGHTGTLDPGASGLLLLVLGPATRLARFLSGAAKSYVVAVRLGVSTDTGDADGVAAAGAYEGAWPEAAAVEAALERFRGTYWQRPPLFSAKKVGGRRSYETARARRTRAASGAAASGAADDTDGPAPAPTRVTVDRLNLVSIAGPLLRLELECSAGFYVRTLAHELGDRLGTGGHVVALRRTRCGAFDVGAALPIDAVEADPAAARLSLVPPAEMLSDLPTVVLTDEGVRHAIHGRELGAGDADPRAGSWPATHAPATRLLSGSGALVGVAEPSARRPGLLHPCVVLG